MGSGQVANICKVLLVFQKETFYNFPAFVSTMHVSVYLRGGICPNVCKKIKKSYLMKKGTLVQQPKCLTMQSVGRMF